eukprot:757604-Hanusia_phi.AAC.3
MRLQEAHKREACLIRQVAQLQEQNAMLSSKLEATSSSLRKALEERDEAVVERRKEAFCRQRLEKQIRDLEGRDMNEDSSSQTIYLEKKHHGDVKLLEALNRMAKSLQSFQSLFEDVLNKQAQNSAELMRQKLSEPCTVMEKSLLEICKYCRPSDTKTEIPGDMKASSHAEDNNSQSRPNEPIPALEQQILEPLEDFQSKSSRTKATQTQTLAQEVHAYAQKACPTGMTRERAQGEIVPFAAVISHNRTILRTLLTFQDTG